MEERIHNINLKPIAEVNRWDTKRVKNYMVIIQKHISYLKSENAPYDVDKKQAEIALERFQNYKKELKRVLDNRENIK